MPALFEIGDMVKYTKEFLTRGYSLYSCCNNKIENHYGRVEKVEEYGRYNILWMCGHRNHPVWRIIEGYHTDINEEYANAF